MMNLGRKLNGDVPMVYHWEGAAVLVAAAISAGASYYSSEEQKKTATKDRNLRQEEAARAKAEEERIAKATRPEGEEAQGIDFGADGTTIGSTEDFLVPKKQQTKSSGLSTSGTGRSGLGFAV